MDNLKFQKMIQFKWNNKNIIIAATLIIVFSLLSDNDLFLIKKNSKLNFVESSKDFLSPRELHAYYLNNSKFKNTKGLSRKDRKSLGLPPNAYFERFYELTMNPLLGYPTTSKKIKLQDSLINLRFNRDNKNKLQLSGKAPGENVGIGEISNDWISIGPNNVGGRTRGALFDTADAEGDRVIAGGVSGGLWVNEDIDATSNSPWTQVTGVPGNLAVSVIVQSTVTPTIMYAGTGESYTQNSAMGNGIYKSIDGGLNWTKIFGNDFDEVVVTPNGNTQIDVENGFFVNDLQLWRNNNIEYIFATVGQGSSGDGEKYEFYDLNKSGLYVSNDNGENWTKIVLPSNGASRKDDLNDIEVDLNNKIWVSTTRNIFFDPGGAFYGSTDGVNFNRISPTYPSIASNSIQRVEFVPSSTNSDTFYVLMSAGSPNQAELYKTTDAFASLTKLNEPADADNGIPTYDFTRLQSFYDLEVEVDPTNGDIVYLGGINLHRSEDGGVTWSQISKWSNNTNQNLLNVSLVHADQHGIYFKPGDSDKGIVVNDGGVYYASSFSTAMDNDTFKFQEEDYVTTQFYKIAQSPIDFEVDIIMGGTQDNGTLKTEDKLFNSLTDFSEFWGGDGGFTYIDQVDTKYVISNYTYNNAVHVYNLSENTSIYPSSSFDSDYSDDSEGDFINPGALDSNLDILYVNATKYNTGSSAYEYKMRRFFDLDTSNPYDDYIMNLPSSPTSFHVSSHTTNSTTLLIGFENGEIQKVLNADTTPTFNILRNGADVIGSVSDLSFGSTENEIYATYYNYGINNIYYTSDGGSTWSQKDGNLPDIPVLAIQYNPFNNNEVIIGTDLGVWQTDNFNDSSPTWEQSNNGMTDVSVNDFEFRGTSEYNNRVVASTYGRGIFVGSFSSDDNTSPTVILTDTDSDNIVNNTDNVTLTATFNENMATAPSISIGSLVTNVSMTAVSSTTWTYVWNVPAGNDGTVTATVSGTDMAGNVYSGSDSITFTIDNTSPTVILTNTDSDNIINNTDNVTLTATFNENMTTAPSISIGSLVTNVSMTAVSSTTWTYVWDVPTGNNGAITATVSGTDIAGNAYSGTDSITFTIDNTSPTVILTDTDSDNIVNNTDNVTLTATFNENMATAPSISIGSLVTNVAMTAVSSATWTYVWNVPAGNDGTVTATVSGTDMVGNVYSGTDSITFTIDNTSSSYKCVTTYDFNSCILNDFVAESSGNVSFVTDYEGCSIQIVRPATVISNKTFGLGTYEIKAKAVTGSANQGIKLLDNTIALDLRPNNTDDEGWKLFINGVTVAGDGVDASGRITTMPVSYPNWYNVKVYVSSTNIKVWLDTVLMADINNFGALNKTEGQVSIGGYSTSRYDNLIYTPIENTSPPLVDSIQYFNSSTRVDQLVSNSNNLIFYSSAFGSDELSLSSLINSSQIIYVSKIMNNCESDRVSIQVIISTDDDLDGIANNLDNCPSTSNSDQLDTDSDTIGDICDNCISVQNSNQLDTDGDGIGDACDVDDDGDGVPDIEDDFPTDYDEYKDSDGDGQGDNSDTDIDNDGILNDSDNCFLIFNPNQLDTDGDNIGDSCDTDDDNDGFSDTTELTCGTDSLDATSLPLDSDSDGIPNCIDTDDDNDGYSDSSETDCNSDPLDSSINPTDTDQDFTPDCLDLDDDNDGYQDDEDAFPLDVSEWLDLDADGIGNNSDLDDDGDGQLDTDELACGSDPLDFNNASADSDKDNLPDCLDIDDDNDGVNDTSDAFPLNPSEWTDTDLDGIGNNADTDDDNDNYTDLDELACDSDPLDKFNKPADQDIDLIPDCIDPDRDGDGFLNGNDSFPDNPREWIDSDRDGLGNNFDVDDDNDNCLDNIDKFPLNPNECYDADNDGVGDNEDLDDDNDSFEDNKLFVSGLLTPGSGGLESTWKIINIEKYPSARVTVYNKNGQKVFSRVMYKNDWRGTDKNSGNLLPSAPYYYIVNPNNGEKPLSGWLYITY